MERIPVFHEINFLIIGQTGSGKTTLARALLDFRLEENISLNPDTTKTYLLKRYLEEPKRYLKIVDTVGFSDLNLSDREIFFQAKTFCQDCDISYVNEIVVTVRADRFSKQEESSLIYFLERLNNKAKHNTSLCFTHCLQKNINYDQMFQDLKSREIFKYIGRNVYFTDIDHFHNYRTNGTLDVILVSASRCDHIHFTKLFEGPILQRHKYDANTPTLIKPLVEWLPNENAGK
jgi:GTPase Era involved in 16S rRNA processing